MLDHRDFMQFLLGVFCGQTAALPTTATFSRQQFLVLLQTLLPNAGITDQTIDEVMALKRAGARQAFRQEANQTDSVKEGVGAVSDFWFTGHCIGFLIERNMQSGWGVTQQLSKITLPENRSYAGVHYLRAVRRLKRNGWAETVVPGIFPAETVIRLTSSCQADLQAALRSNEASATVFVNQAVICQQHSSRA